MVMCVYGTVSTVLHYESAKLRWFLLPGKAPDRVRGFPSRHVRRTQGISIFQLDKKKGIYWEYVSKHMTLSFHSGGRDSQFMDDNLQ